MLKKHLPAATVGSQPRQSQQTQRHRCWLENMFVQRRAGSGNIGRMTIVYFAPRRNAAEKIAQPIITTCISEARIADHLPVHIQRKHPTIATLVIIAVVQCQGKCFPISYRDVTGLLILTLVAAEDGASQWGAVTDSVLSFWCRTGGCCFWEVTSHVLSQK